MGSGKVKVRVKITQIALVVKANFVLLEIFWCWENKV